MRPIVVTAGPLVASAAAVLAASQTPVSGTPLTLTAAALANTALDKPRRVLLTYGNEGSARTMVLVGTNWQGAAISETLAVPAGAGGTVASALDYATLVSATPAGGGYTAAVTLGTNGVAASPWVRLDDYGFAPAWLSADVSGTVNYTVQSSDGDPNLALPQIATTLAGMTWIAHPNMAAQTISLQDQYPAAPLWVRVQINSGTGSVALTVKQAGGKLG